MRFVGATSAWRTSDHRPEHGVGILFRALGRVRQTELAPTKHGVHLRGEAERGRSDLKFVPETVAQMSVSNQESPIVLNKPSIHFDPRGPHQEIIVNRSPHFPTQGVAGSNPEVDCAQHALVV